jgi:serine acetyltransferase
MRHQHVQHCWWVFSGSCWFLQVLAVDLHPAARLGHGILLDHGTGVVIGETAVIGNNVSLLQVRRYSLAHNCAWRGLQ